MTESNYRLLKLQRVMDVIDSELDDDPQEAATLLGEIANQIDAQLITLKEEHDVEPQ